MGRDTEDWGLTSRRRFLATLGAAGAVGLAGCGGGGDGDGGAATPTATRTETETATDTATATPTAESGAVFAVSGLDPADPTIGYKESVEVSATVTNTASTEGTQSVEYRVAGETVDSTSLTLQEGALEGVSFTVEAADFEVGEYTHGVYTEDEEATGTLTVEGLPDLDEPLIAFDTSTVQSGTNTVEATLENDYAFEVTDGEVSLSVPDGWTVASESGTTFDSLGSDASQAVAWELEVPDGADGEYDLTATVAYGAVDQTTEVEVGHTVTVTADALTEGTYRIEAVHSGKVAEVADGSTAEGANVQQWEYNDEPSQQWEAVTVEGDVFKLRNVNSELVAEVAEGSTEDGATVQQGTFEDEDWQLWRIQPAEAGGYKITAVHSEQAMNVYGAREDDGTDIIQWPYEGAENDRWRFTSV